MDAPPKQPKRAPSLTYEELRLIMNEVQPPRQAVSPTPMTRPDKETWNSSKLPIKNTKDPSTSSAQEQQAASQSLSLPFRYYPTPGEVERVPSTRNISLATASYTSKSVKASPLESAHWLEDTVRSSVGQTSEAQAVVTTQNGRLWIEIFPGMHKLLRGSQETQEAWNHGHCIHVLCPCCKTKLACIWNCEYVLCPHCMSVSPPIRISGNASTTTCQASLADAPPSLLGSFSSFSSSFASDAHVLYDASESSFDDGCLFEKEGVGLGIQLH